MNRSEHLLCCLAEECAEVAKDVSKSLRFGLDDRNVLEPNGPTNRERVVSELNDLMGVISMLVEDDIIPATWRSLLASTKKREKVEQFLLYAESVGTMEASK